MVKVAQEEHIVEHSPGVTRGDARFVTINGTTLAAIKEFAKKTEAIAILIQEHHVLEEEIEGHSKWFMGQGWASVWASANKTVGLKKKQGSQAGVAILARKELGLKKPDYVDTILYPHRAVCAVLQPPPLPEILLVSVYLIVGVGSEALMFRYWGKRPRQWRERPRGQSLEVIGMLGPCRFEGLGYWVDLGWYRLVL